MCKSIKFYYSNIKKQAIFHRRKHFLYHLSDKWKPHTSECMYNKSKYTHMKHLHYYICSAHLHAKANNTNLNQTNFKIKLNTDISWKRKWLWTKFSLIYSTFYTHLSFILPQLLSFFWIKRKCVCIPRIIHHRLRFMFHMKSLTKFLFSSQPIHTYNKMYTLLELFLAQQAWLDDDDDC